MLAHICTDFFTQLGLRVCVLTPSSACSYLQVALKQQKELDNPLETYINFN